MSYRYQLGLNSLLYRTPLQYSCLENPVDRGTWKVAVHGVADSQTWLRDFTFTLTLMDRSTKQKISKETQTLKDTMDQLDLIDIYRTFHPKTMNFTFFSSAHRTFFRTDHILGHKSSLGIFKKTDIIPSIFCDHNAVRLDVNYRRKTIKNSSIWRLKNTRGWITNKSQKKSKKKSKYAYKRMKMKTQQPKSYGIQ